MSVRSEAARRGIERRRQSKHVEHRREQARNTLIEAAYRLGPGPDRDPALALLLTCLALMRLVQSDPDAKLREAAEEILQQARGAA